VECVWRFLSYRGVLFPWGCGVWRGWCLALWALLLGGWGVRVGWCLVIGFSFFGLVGVWFLGLRFLICELLVWVIVLFYFVFFGFCLVGGRGICGFGWVY